ncbi:hypothetical protein [Winogradskyella sediminis]|uniref:hypothetical protein n=1 Tax=Winogradskyella sediminis TaxID=1382466 RepID=UPI000E234620|nr:hypothetical protein [Winogradskyella sediminis]REG88214.1 hypothetical protein C8N41_1021074 [Winogradskyella sediminis]
MSKKKESFKDKVYRNLFWILLIIGMLILYASSWTVFNEYIQDILEKIGLSVLSSGVFASVLKSLQFTGIFKKEIEKIVLGTKFIENRNDLPKLWKKVSKSVYDKKFPEISDELDEIILNSYLPIKHKYYYQDFRYTLKIDELTKDNIIKFTQTYSFEVVLEKGENEAKLESVFTIDKIPGLENLVNERLYYKIDGENVLDKTKPEITEDEFEKKMKFSIVVPNKKKFLVETKERREYCINEDNYKLLRVNSITKEMDVSITYPKNMMVSFFNIGLVNKFERKHIDHERTISRIHKKGLILPYQGFGITFGIK